MANWTEATAADLRKDDVFRFNESDHASRVTARWDEGGEVKLFSRDVSTDRPDGLSAVRPATPVQIQR